MTKYERLLQRIVLDMMDLEEEAPVWARDKLQRAMEILQKKY